MHHSFPSIPLNRHNGHETSPGSSSSSVHDIHSAINFACLIKDLTFILLAYWEGAVLSSLIPSIPLNRHNRHETSPGSSSSSVHDIHSAINFACLIRDLTFILLAYWEGAVLSSLYIGRTSPASPCRLNLFLSPRKSHTIGGPSTIHWPVDCYPICRCPIPPPNPPLPRPRPICLISPGQREKSSRERRIARDFENALRSNGYRSIGTSDRFHNWYLIYFAIYIRKCFFSMHVKQKYTRKATVIKGTRRRFSSWEKKCCFSQ